MKKIDNNELSLRILSSTSQGILLYLILSLINYWFSIKGVSLIFTVTIGFISFFVSMTLENMNIKASSRQIVNISIGLLISTVIVIIFNIDRAIPAIFVCASEYFIIWISTIKSVNDEVSGLYDRELFYRNMAIIFVINIIYYTVGSFIEYSPDINQASILLIVFSLFLLIGIRSASTMKNSDDAGKFTQEAIKIVAILLLVFIFSSTWLQTNIIVLIKFTAGVIFKGVYFLSIPVLYTLTFIAEKLKSIVVAKGSSDSGISGDSGKPLDVLAEFDSHSIEQIGSVISIIVVSLVLAFILYFSYKHFIKSKTKKNQYDYSESREFILKSKDYKKNYRFSKMKTRLRFILDDIKLGIGADYDLKIRNEYKRFLIALQNRGIVKNNVTASGIFKQLKDEMRNNKDGLEALTCIYEKIRYGGRGSNKEEYEIFQSSIKAVIKELKD